MTTEPNPVSSSKSERLPWGYLPFAVLPLLLLGMLPFVGEFVEPREVLPIVVYLMLLKFLTCLVGVIVGIYRHRRGDGERYPALRWLVWFPSVFGLVSCVGG